MQAAKAMVTKNTTPVATPAKTQTFNETLRSAVDPKVDQPTHSSGNSKDDKKGKDEKKEHVETAASSTVALIPQAANAVVLPTMRSTTAEPPCEDAEPSTTSLSLESVANTVIPFQAHLAGEVPVVKGDTSPGSFPDSSQVIAKAVAQPRPATDNENTFGAKSTDGTGETDSADSASTGKSSEHVSTFVAVIPDATANRVSAASVVDPFRNAADAMSVAKTVESAKRTSELREEKLQIPDAAENQAIVPVPTAIQEPVSPQTIPSVEALKNDEDFGTKVKAAVGTKINAASKGKSSAPEVHGPREDVKAESQGPDGQVPPEAISKVSTPVVASNFNSSHAGTGEGSGPAVSVQAALGNLSGTNTLQSLTDAKTGSDGTVTAAPAPPAANSLEAVATPTLSSASLVQSIHQSEMKVGMNSVEFGSISISTAVSHQALSAQISLDHPELSRVLSSHLSAVEEKLGQVYGLPARVEVRDGGSSSYGDSRQQPEREPQGSRGFLSRGADAGFSSKAVALGPTTVAANATARLDIRI